jgi:hypothetical protein
MKHLKLFNENQSVRHKIEQHNQNYRELANILQSEVLDDYDIYEGYLSEKRDENGNFTNKPCWLFNGPKGLFIYHICIYPKNRLTKEGEETVKNLSKEIELLKSMINDFLGIKFEIKEHSSFLLIFIKDSFYNGCIQHFKHYGTGSI